MATSSAANINKITWVDKEEVIEALQQVISIVNNSDRIREANFKVDAELAHDYHGGVWVSKVPTRWYDLDIHLNYKVRNIVCEENIPVNRENEND